MTLDTIKELLYDFHIRGCIVGDDFSNNVCATRQSDLLNFIKVNLIEKSNVKRLIDKIDSGGTFTQRNWALILKQELGLE